MVPLLPCQAQKIFCSHNIVLVFWSLFLRCLITIMGVLILAGVKLSWCTFDSCLHEILTWTWLLNDTRLHEIFTCSWLLNDGLISLWMPFYSMGIESVVDESSSKASGGIHDAMCPACEMTVVWVQNQLKQNQTQDRILSYINEVKCVYGAAFSISFGDCYSYWLDLLILTQLCDRMPSSLGQSAVDCGKISSMPSVAFTISGKVFELTPEDVRCHHKLSWTSFLVKKLFEFGGILNRFYNHGDQVLWSTDSSVWKIFNNTLLSFPPWPGYCVLHIVSSNNWFSSTSEAFVPIALSHCPERVVCVKRLTGFQ